MHALYLVIPDEREREALFQLRRPAVRNQGVGIKYILQRFAPRSAGFGADHTMVERLARQA